MTVTGVSFNVCSSAFDCTQQDVVFVHSFVDIKPTLPACRQTTKGGS